ncbi:Rne/Rng family ribonuclease [Bacteroidota bacterium]
MSKEIVIQATKNETRIAIIEDGALAELYVENPENARTIGDIHLGRVRNVMPSIQAAFVNIGQKQDAFLHFSDVGETLVDLLKMIGEEPLVGDVDVHVPRVHRSIRASGEYDSSPSKKGEAANGAKKSEYVHPARYLRNGEKILVQIVKEPISSKGNRITSHVALAGRFLVLVPFGDYVAVSKKIWSARERKRLQAVGRSLLPDGFGLIIRTVAAEKDAKTLHTDLSLLVKKWERIIEKLESNPAPPKLLHQDVSMVSSIIRDLFTDDYDRILIDDQRLYKSVQTYIKAIAPSMLPAIQYHDSKQPVFEAVGVDAAIAEAFTTRVELPTGGYLIIEHTEAMHVIDVNSGRAGKGQTQEENSLKVDLEAASAIAHQLRIRDLGGIIVVDFIDLRDDKNRNKVVNRLKQEFRKDRAVTKVLPMSDFGLIQITRQRLRPSITTDEAAREEAEQLSESDVRATRKNSMQPAVSSVEDVLKRLEQDLAALRNNGEKGHVTLTVHPFFAAFLKKGIPNKLNRLRLRYRIMLALEESEYQIPTEFSLVAQKAAVPSSKKIEPAAEAVPDSIRDVQESSVRTRLNVSPAQKTGDGRKPSSNRPRSVSDSKNGRSNGGRSDKSESDKSESDKSESDDEKGSQSKGGTAPSNARQSGRSRGGRNRSRNRGRGQGGANRGGQPARDKSGDSAP